MRRLVSGLLSVLFIALVSAACAPTEESTTAVPETAPVSISDQPSGRFIHVVFFYMNEAATDADRDALIQDCRDYLGSVETVRYLNVGAPAGTPREVVDNSYGVGLVIHFDDTAGYEVYETAPRHLEFIERNQHRWSRVQVYDILVP